MSIILQDASGYLWTLGYADGQITATEGSLGTASAVYLNDPSGATSWQLGISTVSGTTEITATAVTLGAYPTALPLVSGRLLAVDSSGNLSALTGFIADASLVKLSSAAFQPGAFQAGAFQTIQGIGASLTADAILKKAGIAGSFTADAYLRPEILGQHRTFTADAILHRNVSHSFTANAFISKGKTTLEVYFTGGSAWTDVSERLFNGALSKDWKTNQPQELTFSLEDYESGFSAPEAGNRVRLTTVRYGVFFNGYLDTTPKRQVLGSNNGAPVYGYQCHAVSEEVTLEWAAATRFGTWAPFVGMTQGAIIKAILSGLGSSLDTGGIDDGVIVPFFRLKKDEGFWGAVRRLLDKTNVRFWAENGSAFLRAYTDEPFGYIPDESDSRFNPYDLDVSIVQNSVYNDVVGFGSIEPQDYAHEYFLGDGLTASFPLKLPLYGAVSSKLLEDDFTSGAIDTTTWLATDPGAEFNASTGSLVLSGSTPARITAKQGLEISGSLDLTPGRVQFSGANDAILGGVFGSDTGAMADCIAGLRASPSGSDTVLQPILSGSLVGPTYAVQSSKTYQFYLQIDCSQAVRYQRAFYSLQNGFGGVPVPAGAKVSFTVYELPDNEADLPTLVVSWSGSLSSVTEFAYYTPVASLGSCDLALNYCALNRAVSAQVWTKPAPYKQTVLSDQQDEQYRYYWRLGSASATDLSMATALSFYGGYRFLSGAVSGDSDGSLYLDGNTGYAQAPPDAYFSGGPFTVEAIVKPGAVESGARVIDFGNGAGVDNIVLSVSQGTTGKPYFQADSGSSSIFSITAPTALPVGKWSHLVGTWDGVTARLYVNGLLVAEAVGALDSSGANLQPAPVTRNNCYIGKSNWGSDALYYGQIDELAIYNAALNVNQVIEHYRAISGNWTRERIGDKTDLLARCTVGVGSDSQHEIDFFSGAQPAPGEKLRVVYRSAGVARARVKDTTSIAAEAAKSGDSGERAAYLPSLQATPRNAAELETAIQAYIDDHTAIVYEGTWKFNSEMYPESTNPIPGRIIDVKATTRYPEFNALVTEVKSTFNCLDDNLLEVITHEVSFGPLLLWDSIQQDFQPPAETIQGQLDTLIDVSAISFDSVGTSFAADRPDADFDGTYSSTAYEIDASAAPDSSYELRKTDQGWGSAGLNSVSDPDTETFTVPRNSRDISVFLKNKDGSGRLSRYATMVRMVWPMKPSAPSGTTFDLSDPANPVVNIDPSLSDDLNAWGYEIRASDNRTVLARYGALVLLPSDLSWTLENNASHQPTLWIYAYNLLGEYSDGYKLSGSIPVPGLSYLAVDETNAKLVWTSSDAATGAVTTGYRVDVATDSGFSSVVLSKTVTDEFLALDDENLLRKRWFRVTPLDAISGVDPVRNGDFSEGFAGWTVDSTVTATVESTEVPENAANAVKIVQNGNQRAGIEWSSLIDAEAGQTFLVSASMYCPSLDANGYGGSLQLVFYDSGGSYLGLCGVTQKTAATWESMVSEGTAPAGTAYAVLHAWGYSVSAPTSDLVFYFTNIAVNSTGTPMSITHVHTCSGVGLWDNTDNTYSVPNPPSPSTDITPPSPFSAYQDELRGLSQQQWRLQIRAF